MRTMIGCLLHALCPGPHLRPRHVLGPEIQPATFWFTERHSSQLSHTGQGIKSFNLCALQNKVQNPQSGKQSHSRSGLRLLSSCGKRRSAVSQRPLLSRRAVTRPPPQIWAALGCPGNTIMWRDTLRVLSLNLKKSDSFQFGTFSYMGRPGGEGGEGRERESEVDGKLTTGKQGSTCQFKEAATIQPQ